jgi:hypothetical protein
MKHFISIVTLLFCVIFSLQAGAFGQIDHMENMSGAAITQAAIGQEFYVIGSDFGNNGGDKNIVIDCSTPLGGFFMQLSISEWSDTRIKARIPELTSNAYRESLYETAGPFPEDIREYMEENLVNGRIKIIREGVLRVLTNVVAFSVAPPPEIKLYSRPVVGRQMHDQQKFQAKKPELTARTPSEEPPIELKAVQPNLEAQTFQQREIQNIEKVQPPLTALADMRAEITSVQKDMVPVGSVLTITGNNFGGQNDKVVSLYFWHPNVPQSFYMDLNVISWEPTRIIAEIPSWDSRSFRISPYEEKGFLPASIKDRVSPYYKDGILMIMRIPDERLSNSYPFRLSPAGTPYR